MSCNYAEGWDPNERLATNKWNGGTGAGNKRHEPVDPVVQALNHAHPPPPAQNKPTVHISAKNNEDTMTSNFEGLCVWPKGPKSTTLSLLVPIINITDSRSPVID